MRKKLIKNPDLQLNLRGKIHDGALYADQGTIAGCSGGTYSNIMEAAYLLENKSTGNDAFNLSVYPSSQAVMMDLLKKGAIETLAAAGATIRTAIFAGRALVREIHRRMDSLRFDIRQETSLIVRDLSRVMDRLQV